MPTSKISNRGVAGALADEKASQSPDFRLLIDSAPALIHTALPDGYLDFFNQAWLNYVGRSLKDLLGWRWTEYIHPEDLEGIVQKWRASLASGEPFLHEARVRRADGEYRTFLHQKVPLRDKLGQVVKWYGSSFDIEDRKRAEDSLRRSEALLAEAQRLTNVGSWVYRAPDTAEYWSPVSYKIFGIDPTDGPPKNLNEFLSHVHPDDRERLLRATDEILDGGGKVYELKYRIVRPDGGTRVLREVGAPVSENSAPLRFVGAWMDITEQEQLTQALQRSEAYLAEAQHLSHTGSFGWSVHSGEIIWSDETYRIFEYDRSTTPTVETVLQRVHPDDRAQVREVIERASKDLTDYEHEHRLLMPVGSVKHLRVVAHALRDDGGNVEFVGAVMDVTGVKVAEEKLRQDEMELRQLVDAIPQQILVLEADGTVFYANRRFLEYSGRTVVEAHVDDVIVKAYHSEDLERVRSERNDAIARGIPWETEARLLGKDGQYRWFLVRLNPLRDESGRIVRWYGTRTDIDDRKQAEAALRKSEQQWRDVFENNPTMYFMVDAGGNVLAVNPFGAEQLGYQVNELVDRPVVEVFYEADRATAQANVAQCLKRLGQSFSWELRKVRKNGSMLWVRETARAVLRDSAAVVLIACEDITERKHAEERVREQEIELRQMLDLAPQLMFVERSDGSRLLTNHAALDYYGVTLEEWRNSDRSKMFYPGDWERILREVNSKFLAGEPHEAEGRLLRKDGTYRWFLLRRNPLHDEKGHVSRWYVAATDIEDRKQAEERLRNENVALREEISKASMFEEIVGSSPALRTVLSRIAKVAPTASTVLIAGETGTGKELVARAIHRRSLRCSRPFVSVNCAAIPRDLIASELFGHEKGAFTGALQRRIGKFELAEGGTLFLDEIGELPAETQIALLRVLQEREFERVGGNQAIRTDVRVIAATNRDLQSAIAAGTFRSDLFYRLNVFPIEVPPLRERRDDIPMLVEYFIDRFARQSGKKITSVDKKTLELVQAYPWPGNIRELQNVVERSVVLAETETFFVDESWLSPASPSLQSSNTMLSKRPALQEKEIIEAALAETKGRVSGPAGAAAKLGVPSTTLESKIKSLKINKHQFKTT